jgi:hypothetical protein
MNDRLQARHFILTRVPPPTGRISPMALEGSDPLNDSSVSGVPSADFSNRAIINGDTDATLFGETSATSRFYRVGISLGGSP